MSQEKCLTTFLNAKGKLMNKGDAVPAESETNLDGYRKLGLIGDPDQIEADAANANQPFDPATIAIENALDWADQETTTAEQVAEYLKYRGVQTQATKLDTLREKLLEHVEAE